MRGDGTIEWTGPLPATSPETKPFWDGCDRGELLIQRCDACGRFQHPYRAFCCHCWTGAPVDVVASGRGTVWSHSVVHRNQSRGQRHTGAYVVAVVELDEGPRLISNIVGCDPATVSIGSPVTLDFAVAPSGSRIPVFRLA